MALTASMIRTSGTEFHCQQYPAGINILLGTHKVDIVKFKLLTKLEKQICAPYLAILRKFK